MTKFVPNKEHSRTALIFCFHLKTTATKSYRLLGEAYDEHAPSQKTCERWFQRFKIGDFAEMLQTRNTENRPKSTKMWNCKHCWMKMIHKHKNNSQNNWALVNKLFPIAYERCERFRKSADELNERQMERRKNTYEILLERYRRKSFLYRYWGWKVDFFFRIPSAKNHG